MSNLVYEFTINYPNCEHSMESTARTREGMEDLAKTLIERQHGLCHNCYYDLCNRTGSITWWSK